MEVGVPPPSEALGVGVGLDGESVGAGWSSPDLGVKDVSCPVTAARAVVPLPPPKPPPKLSPDTSSYTVIPVMVTPKTRAAASTGHRRPAARARWRVPSVNSPGCVGRCCGDLDVTVASRSVAPVRLKGTYGRNQ
ncbi:hypothetical protein [Streptomyces sp. NPDC088350]|uniref:hypothetical protein n=1 Tax=Streptomyces sp. NPDC088350 TaxID=3365854 RepID=UPI0038094C85